MCLTSKGQVFLLRLEWSSRTHTRWSHNTCSWTRILEFSHVGTRAVGDTPLVKILSPCDPRKSWKHGDEVTRQLVDNYLCVTAVGAIQAFTPEDWTHYQMYHEQVLSVGLSRLVLTYWDVLCFAWCPVCSWSMTLPMLFFSDTLFVLRRFGFVWTN